MAVFVPAIASALGASASTAATVGTVATVATTAASIGGTIMSARAQAQAGAAQEQQAKQAAELEGIKARDQAIERRKRLIDALAHQTARVGASGAVGASPAGIMTEDIASFEREDFAADTLSNIKQRNMVSAGKAAKSSARTSAGMSLLSGAQDAYKAFGR